MPTVKLMHLCFISCMGSQFSDLFALGRFFLPPFSGVIVQKSFVLPKQVNLCCCMSGAYHKGHIRGVSVEPQPSLLGCFKKLSQEPKSLGETRPVSHTCARARGVDALELGVATAA